jgi:hypothetical protein
MIESLKVNVLGVIFSINAFLPLVRKSSIEMSVRHHVNPSNHPNGD